MSVGRSQEEHVVAVDLGVEWDPVAPCPHLVQSEQDAHLAFWLKDPVLFGSSAGPQAAHACSSLPRVGVLAWRGRAGAYRHGRKALGQGQGSLAT